jgi:hypothetical protein
MREMRKWEFGKMYLIAWFGLVRLLTSLARFGLLKTVPKMIAGKLGKKGKNQ